MTAATTRLSFTLVLPDGTQLSGPIVDLRGWPTAPTRTALVRAVHAGSPVPETAPAVLGQAPGPAYEHVGLLRPGRSFDRRSALASIAVARGIETPQDSALASARRQLRAAPTPLDTSELREARRRAAEAGSKTERLRERVATIRGRVTALREATGDDADLSALADAEDSLAAATRRLSEVSTQRVAARQRLALLDARARSARDDRDRRLQLEDRIGNLERARRDARVSAVEPAFVAARQRIASRVSSHDTAPRSDALIDALAAARLTPARAPIVVAPDVVALLGGVAAAADVLTGPLLIR
ncbi:MAG: hypothetical protein ABEI27_01995 [Halobellus sp.]|uniref:DUF7856 family protein n=1 Tax=Halobellus sp. TaxID=1979212 RepID=UPI0035D4E304